MEEKNILESLDYIMRLLRRSGAHHPRGGRGAGKIMYTIKQNPGISTKELALELDVRPSSLNEILGRLAEDGFIERKRSAEDLRVYEVSLTENGEKKMQEEKKRGDEMTERVNALLSAEEREQFLLLADKLAAGLETFTPEERPEPPHMRRDF